MITHDRNVKNNALHLWLTDEIDWIQDKIKIELSSNRQIIDEIIKLFEVCNFPKDFGRKLFTTKFSMKQFHSIKWMESNNNLMKYFLKSERKLQFSNCSKHTCNKFQLTIKI